MDIDLLDDEGKPIDKNTIVIDQKQMVYYYGNIQETNCHNTKSPLTLFMSKGFSQGFKPFI